MCTLGQQRRRCVSHRGADKARSTLLWRPTQTHWGQPVNRVLLPLRKFYCQKDTWDLGPGIVVRKFDDTPDLGGHEKYLGSHERAQLKNEVRYWLVLDDTANATWGYQELANILQLALWCVRKNSVSVPFRFECNDEPNAGQLFSRLLDRMHSPSRAATHFDDNELAEAASYFRGLLAIPRQARLNNAVVMTLLGCFQARWQSAVLLHATAMEALVTWSEHHVTRRAGWAFAALVEADAAKMPAAYDEFVACYKGRSELIHGRASKFAAGKGKALRASWERILRCAWSVVLCHPYAVSELNRDDTARELFFQLLAQGWPVPPPRGSNTQGPAPQPPSVAAKP